MTSKVNSDGALIFEYSFARVPFEQARKGFRTSQRIIDREFTGFLSTADEIGALSGDSTEDIDKIDSLITRVEALKRRLSELHSTSTVPNQRAIRTRVKHINTLESFNTIHDPQYSQWADTRIDRWIVDWSLRNGYPVSAKKITNVKGIDDLVDVNLFDDVRRVEDALRRHSCSEALAWCNENKASLRKIKITLEFELRLQEFIEMARSGQQTAAIAYSKKHLISWRETHMREIMQAMALLACSPATTRSAEYKRLYDSARWSILARTFRQAAYTLNSLPSESFLDLALYAGLAALKLPSCFEPSSKNDDCPICDQQGLGQLALEVPRSHHLNSTIVCRLNGSIMDDNNPPLAFPNGHVYSKKALEEMADKNEGRVTCPRSGQMCNFSDLRKVFIS